MLSPLQLAPLDGAVRIRPLARLGVAGVPDGACVQVFDGANRLYFESEAGETPGSFIVGGALGTQRVEARDAGGVLLGCHEFQVEATTSLDDGGPFKALFDVLNRTLRCYSPSGEGSVEFQGQTFRFFVPWILDHFHTAKGMRYFSAATGELVELLARVQREDGMIWSFAQPDAGPGFFDTRDAGQGYTRRGEGLLLVRQPSENHCEANFVGALFLAWQSAGNDEWMTRHLDAAIKALNYSMHDRARWSEKFGLLKRGYTIDSWDFQVEDEYAVAFPIGSDMLIDPDRTRFGVFFGDNTGYAHACTQLAQMLRRAGRGDEAREFDERAGEILERLTALSWNGAFFRHRVEEDPSVVRDLRVDEAKQIAMSNAYSLNRGIAGEQCAGIVNTYENLKAHLPPGSPGEWYAIYPPFERGFGPHGGKWQYMNGGVHGHAAGELARGALQHGFERYGADILRRVGELAQRTDGLVHFAYTGAFEEPPAPPKFSPLDLSPFANMDVWSEGDPQAGVPGWMKGEEGNDLRSLPTGEQSLAGAAFLIADPQRNARRVAVAVERGERLPAKVEVPVGTRAGAIYLLHTANALGASGVAGALTFHYDDGTRHSQYLLRGQHLTGWWFPALEGDQAGVAWRGPNPRCTDVGLCWAAIPNPHPAKTIRSLVFEASHEGATYALLGLTLADRMPAKPVSLISTGGPDNWAGGTCMAALLEGLAGVTDAGAAFEHVRFAPRWAAADVQSVAATVHYPASGGYFASRYAHHQERATLELQLTGSGESCACHVLLPEGVTKVEAVEWNERALAFSVSCSQGSCYADFALPNLAPSVVSIGYTPGVRA